jgi:menaquinol-cytochrome c reductase iron-sulfur subunit
MSSDLQASKRFQPPKERRDFLGLASLWSAGIAILIGLLGALRLPVPAVFPESNSRVKLGPWQRFERAQVTSFPEYRLWVYSDAGGLYAISAICTHLGCTVAAQEGGGFFFFFFCSRFGSFVLFGPSGAVLAGPAPRPLVHLELFVSPDGQLVVDQQKEVGPQVRLKV